MTYTDISISHLATMPDIIIHLSHEQLEELLQKNKVVINMGSSDVFLPISERKGYPAKPTYQ